MADLTARIKPKKSSTAGEVPQASDLEVAELAVNTADGKLFVKHTDDSIKEISGGGGGISSPDVGRYYNFPTKDADTTPSTAGSWSDRTNQIGLNITDANGVRLNGPKMLSLKTGDKVWLNLDNAGWVEKTLTGNMTYSTSGGGFYYFSLGESVSSYTTVQFAIEPPVLQDGMMLEYVAANTQWEHAYGGRPKSRFAVYEYDSGSATPAPTTGIFCFWSGANYAINQTDFRGTFHGGRLLASPTSFDVKVYASGSLVYDGTISNLTNVNSNRATFSFGSNAWVANLIDGQLVEFYADAFDGGEYYANKGDVKVHDGTDFEARPLFTYNLADVNGVAANNEILKYNSANGGYEPSLPALSDNSDYAFGKALFGSYTYNASAGSIPSVGITDAYSGSNWAVNVVDNLGVNHQTALYAQTTTTNVDIYVDGVFQVSTTIGTWGNKNNNRCTFLIGNDTWKTSLTGGELIEFYGEPFTFSDVANSNGQVLAWNSTLSAFQPTTLSASDLSDVDTSPVVASPAQPYNTYDSNWPTVTQGEWSGNGTDKTRIYLHRLDANGNEFEPLATVGTGKEVQIRFQTGSTDYGWVTYVVDVTTIDGDIKQMVMVSPSTHPEAPGNYNSIEVRALVQTPATDGQLLAWNGTASAFQPTTPSISALSDVNPVTYAQGYQVTQGNFANAGEFALNGSGLIFDFRSQNGLGNIPQPQDNGSLWFSTSEFGPFTELKIVGNIGLTGSFAYSIGDFVDRSPLDAVLTGSTVIYWHTVDPSAGPSDGQVLTYVAANSQWEPGNPAVDSNVTQAGTGANAINNLVTISQVDYDALGTPDANTVYFII